MTLLRIRYLTLRLRVLTWLLERLYGHRDCR